MTTRPRTIPLARARRIALAAQGFARPRPTGQITRRDLARVLRTVAVVQIDSVNVLTRSHYLPFFSRLGAYDREILDAMRDRGPRAMIEYWAHEASLIELDTWPLLSMRMRRAAQEAWGSVASIATERPELLVEVRERVTRQGPMTARQVAAASPDQDRTREHWGWNWSDTKRALEYLFWSGQITSAGRNSAFERRYSSLRRAFPASSAHLLDTEPDPAAAVTQLVHLSACALGIATRSSLRDYFRLRPDETDAALAALTDAGELTQVRVDGWSQQAYLHRDAKQPRSVSACALLSPFDSLVWDRRRCRELFNFDFKLEIYTPAAKRQYGYYVLPFLFGDSLVARCDLKADRAASVLRASVTWEPDAPADAAGALTGELASMASWLGMHQVVLREA